MRGVSMCLRGRLCRFLLTICSGFALNSAGFHYNSHAMLIFCMSPVFWPVWDCSCLFWRPFRGACSPSFLSAPLGSGSPDCVCLSVRLPVRLVWLSFFLLAALAFVSISSFRPPLPSVCPLHGFSELACRPRLASFSFLFSLWLPQRLGFVCLCFSLFTRLEEIPNE